MNCENPIPTPKQEKQAFDEAWDHEKNMRHTEGLQQFTGFWHGTYFHHGIAQENKGSRSRLLKNKTLYVNTVTR